MVPVGLVNVAMGGSSINEWQKDAANHTDLVDNNLYGRIKYHIQQQGNIRAVLWQQGETDAVTAMPRSEYSDKLTTFINDLRADTNAFHFFVAKVSHCGTLSTNCNDRNTEITGAQNDVVAADSGVYGGPTTDSWQGETYRACQPSSDGECRYIHFNGTGLQSYVGPGWYNNVVAAMPWLIK